MLHSTMLPSKIFGTKKRLSSDRWLHIKLGLAWVGFFIIAGFLIRTVGIEGSYGLVSSEFPVLTVAPKDPTLHRVSETTTKQLSKVTPVIVLTENAFYFGDIQSFSTDLHDVRSKFVIPHEDQTPQLGKLIDALKVWSKLRYDKKNIAIPHEAILLPKGLIPMNIVIQVLDQLKREQVFERIVLSSDIL